MQSFSVNVRAIVSAVPEHADAPAIIPGWEIYDYEAPEEGDDAATIRCDQLVQVEAATQDEAVEEAKAKAGAIEMEGWSVEGVDLWVDEGIDIEPGHAAASPKP